MSKTDKSIRKYLGYKFYKIIEDNSIDLIRLIGINDFNNKVSIYNEKTKKKSELNFDLLKDYTPLEPTGFMMFNRVGIYTDNSQKEVLEDVVVTIYRLLDIKMDINEPYAICRQSVNDFFYQVISNNPDKEMVGVCATRDNAPTKEMFATLAACDELYESVMVNFYLDDILDNILMCLDTKNFDYTLNKLFDDHMIHKYKIKFTSDVLVDDGWCKNLHTLLKENNVITDLDTLRNIISIDINLMDYLEKENEEVWKFNNEMKLFFEYTFKLNLNKTMVITFDYDINLGDFNESNYCLIRDNTNTLYLVVYTLEGQYLEADLIKEYESLGIADKIRLSIYNKYAELMEK